MISLRKNKPVILFEFGLGGSDLYGTTGEMMYDFLESCGLSVSTLDYFLKGQAPFNRVEFVGQFNKSYNFFFIAYDVEKSLIPKLSGDNGEREH